MMRNGIVQMLGFLICKGFSSPDKESDKTESEMDTRDSLLNILEERFHDVNSYTRGKVIQTWLYLYQYVGILLFL